MLAADPVAADLVAAEPLVRQVYNDELHTVHDAYVRGHLTYGEYVTRREQVLAHKRTELRLGRLHREIDGMR
jgi:hypothetical protein